MSEWPRASVGERRIAPLEFNNDVAGRPIVASFIRILLAAWLACLPADWLDSRWRLVEVSLRGTALMLLRGAASL